MDACRGEVFGGTVVRYFFDQDGKAVLRIVS